MKSTFRLGVFAFACAIAPLAAAVDEATIKLRHGDHTETLQLPLSSLKVGESRQLAAESGMPAIVTRHDEGLRIEMAGRVTEVPLIERGGDGHRVHFVRSGDDGETGAKHVIIKHRSQSVDVEGHGDPDVDIDALLAELEHDVGTADGERTIIIRRKRERAD
jgi:hypothetical protein